MRSVGGGAFFGRSLGKVRCPLERAGQVERGLPRTGDYLICTRPAPSALSRTQNACDTLAGASTVTASIGSVAEDILPVVCGAGSSGNTTLEAQHSTRELHRPGSSPDAAHYRECPRPVKAPADALASAARAQRIGQCQKVAWSARSTRAQSTRGGPAAAGRIAGGATVSHHGGHWWRTLGRARRTVSGVSAGV